MCVCVCVGVCVKICKYEKKSTEDDFIYILNYLPTLNISVHQDE